MTVPSPNDRLPYRPIRIIDISPVHSSLRDRATRTRWARIRYRVLGARSRAR